MRRVSSEGDSSDLSEALGGDPPKYLRVRGDCKCLCLMTSRSAGSGQSSCIASRASCESFEGFLDFALLCWSSIKSSFCWGSCQSRLTIFFVWKMLKAVPRKMELLLP